MNNTTAKRGEQRALWIFLSVVLAAVLPASAQLPHLSITQPGGMPGKPVITGIEKGSNTVTVTWDGPAGYYQLYQKPSVTATTWQKLGGVTLARKAVVSIKYSNSLFRVSGPQASYAGVAVCADCHPTTHSSETKTRHASAFSSSAFAAAGGQSNKDCLACHTVGYKVTTGFVSKSTTPHLAGVQCENCHGPAGNHAANDSDPVARPRVELASQVCGGCHNGQGATPIFEEWESSGHADFISGLNNSDQINSCGRCHSGSVRNALVHKLNPKVAVTNDAEVPIVCATCHDPHAKYVRTNVLSGAVYTSQLRNPVSSTNDYYLNTTESFSSKYNSKVNMCGQCHNHRGASWTNTASVPHGSLQYNMLLGSVGELLTEQRPYQPGAHALEIEKQCISCHMQTTEGTETQPQSAGHSFRVNSYELCMQCHPFPEELVSFTQFATSTQIQDVKALLDYWAATKAPAELYSKYGVRAWEYTSPGRLSNARGDRTPGPSAAEQAQIPEGIKKARYNMYLVFRDGSLGVHNAPYAVTLLDEAERWITAELDQ